LTEIQRYTHGEKKFVYRGSFKLSEEKKKELLKQKLKHQLHRHRDG